MTDTVNSDVLIDGLRNYVIRLQNVSDGTGESAVTKVDISALAGPDGINAPSYFAIEQIEYSIQGMDYVQILFDATTDDEAATLSGQGYSDYRGVGGHNDPQSTGTTGDINLTTSGAVSGGSYDITLHLRKKL